MAQIQGRLEGLKVGSRRALERIGQRRIPPGSVVQPALAIELISVSKEISREVGIVADRSGEIEKVIVGEDFGMATPEKRASGAPRGRLSGRRFIHVHLRGELIDIEDILLLTRCRYDFLCALTPDRSEKNPMIEMAFPRPGARSGPPYDKIGPKPISAFSIDADALVAAIEADIRRTGGDSIPTGGKERTRAILVHVSFPGDGLDAEACMEELEKLARSAGVEVGDKLFHRRTSMDPASFVGKGKLVDIMVRSMVCDADLVILDHNLNPRQARNMSDLMGLQVIDRAQIILDIFAQRAHTRDGKIQVELAQLKYLMPRLAQKDDALSRLTGGIGARGPGETKLEIGRRRVKERIARLSREIERITADRRVRRKRRERSGAALVALVGYTNAGKSTILNALAGCSEPAEDMLFSTLDPRTRRMRLPSGRSIVLTDTVGLIRQLPPSLLAAFRPTFEEIGEASLILVVIDGAHDRQDEHMKMVDMTLSDLQLDAIPRLNVLNKTDISSSENIRRLLGTIGGVPVSATRGTGMEHLLEEIDRRLASF